MDNVWQFMVNVLEALLGFLQDIGNAYDFSNLNPIVSAVFYVLILFGIIGVLSWSTATDSVTSEKAGHVMGVCFGSAALLALGILAWAGLHAWSLEQAAAHPTIDPVPVTIQLPPSELRPPLDARELQ